VVLSHLGFAQDAKLVAEVPGIDALLSGHTHNRLYRPAWVGSTPIIRSGCHGSFVGRLDLTVDGGRVIDVRHELICVDGQRAARRHCRCGRHAPGVLKRLALRAPILPGAVTMEHFGNIVPTHPSISTVELTGDELRAMLEANLARTYSPDPYCQMRGFVKRCRGLNLYFKMENPKGQRIEDLLVDGVPIQPGRIYRAAMLGEQRVPKKYGSKRQKIDIDAIQSLQQLFARGTQVRGTRRGSVVAI